VIIIKPGASIIGLRADMLQALYTINDVFGRHGVDGIITSGTEPDTRHSVARSAHYRGDAVDWRSKHLASRTEKHVVVGELKATLGPDFVVILENIDEPNEHFHTHWSPVYHGRQ
jgi:hypothetical protein